MKTYSQGKEQEWILRYFGNRKGTFMDLGANDGETLSNSRALALTGWDGLLVEPAPIAYAKLLRLYADTDGCHECMNTGVVGDSESTVALLYDSGEHLGIGDSSLLSTMKKNEMNRWSGVKFMPIEVRCVTVSDLLLASRFKTFEFITMDIEGFDLEVLRQIDLTAVGCRMLIVEFNGKDEGLFTAHCKVHGLKLRHKNGENLCFTR